MTILSVAWLKFIKGKVTFKHYTKGVLNQVSSNLDHEIKSYSCSSSSTKMGKNKKVLKIFWVSKWGNKGITNRSIF